MRKTLNINLGGMAFIIDENAYELLHNYLEALRQKFSNEVEREEIMNDIEARMGEMLSHKLVDRKEIVSIEDAQTIIDTMGRPEDIAGEDNTTTNTNVTSSASYNTASNASVNKKLFRDPDDAKMGGVIAGLCHYFGIEDPVWVRIAAIILIPFTSGAIILFYLLLLVIVPKANTAAEKLQMRGEPININTIEREIKEAASRAGESINSVVRDTNFFEKLGHIIVSIASVILKIFAGFVMAIAMIVLISVLISFLVVHVAAGELFAQQSLLITNNLHTASMFSYGFLLFFGAPVVAIIYLALRGILGQRTRVTWLKWTLLGGWFLGLALLLISGWQVLTNFKMDGTKRQHVALTQPTGSKFYVQLIDSSGNKLDKFGDNIDWTFDWNAMQINGVSINDMDKIPLNKPTLQLIASENDSFYMQEIVSSRGRSRVDAEKNAETTIYSFTQADTVLNLTKHLYIPKNGKIRGQRITVQIAIPEGKTISLADNVDILDVEVKGNSNYDDADFANTTWTVQGGKVKCTVCDHGGDGKSEETTTQHHHQKIKEHIKKVHEQDKKNEDKDENKDQDF